MAHQNDPILSGLHYKTYRNRLDVSMFRHRIGVDNRIVKFGDQTKSPLLLRLKQVYRVYWGCNVPNSFVKLTCNRTGLTEVISEKSAGLSTGTNIVQSMQHFEPNLLGFQWIADT